MSHRAVRCAVLVALAACAAAPAPAGAAETKRWRIQSPDGRLAATIRFHGPDAPLRAVVRRRGEPVLTTTIGLATATRCLPQGFTPKATRRATTFERYRTRAGKRRVHRLLAHRLDLSFRQRGSRVLVELRASDDGFAYRTSLTGPARSRVTGECSAFTAPGAQAWLQRFNRAYEAPYTPSLLRDALPGPIGYPALLRTGGAWTLLAESDVGTGQPGDAARGAPGDPRRAVRGPAARAAGPVAGAHAVARRGDRPAGHDRRVRPRRRPGPPRAARRLVLGQAGSRRLVVVGRQRQPGQPRRAAGLRRLRRAAWAGSTCSSTPAGTRRGCRSSSPTPGGATSGSCCGRAGTRSRCRRQRDALLSQWRSWGVAGVKLDFMESDSYQRMAWYRSVARAAAERRLVVNFHGSTAPRGLARSWPNVLTIGGRDRRRELQGRRAAAITPAHNATLPFTRNAIGSMDYTPVTFSAARRQTSAAHELALSVVFESGLQHFADRPDVYAAPAAARRWLRAVPPAWDDTKLLDGYPGDSATIGRRAGRSWYVGADQRGRRAHGPAAAGLPLPRPALPRADRRGRAGRDAAGARAPGHRAPRAAPGRSAPRAATRSASSPSGADQSGRRPGRPVPGRCQWATSGSSTSQQR